MTAKSLLSVVVILQALTFVASRYSLAQQPLSGSAPYVTVEASPPSVTLQTLQSSFIGMRLKRRLLGDTDWNFTLVTLPGSVQSYRDSTVQSGKVYEYNLVPLQDYGYEAEQLSVILTAVVGQPPVQLRAVQEQRGIIALLIDADLSAEISIEVRRLAQDLVGDGWQVIQHIVPRSTPVPEVKALLRNIYQQHGASFKSAMLLGHLPVPFSGATAWDGHQVEHSNAWSTDRYYTDLDGNWSDINDAYAGSLDVYTEVSPRFAGRNFPNDGRFDEGQTPSAQEISVGRVDFYNLPAFLPKSEAYLLKEYLNKNHRYRQGELQVPKRAVGFDYGNPWTDPGDMVRDLASYFGKDRAYLGDPFAFAEGPAGGSYLAGKFSDAGFYQGMHHSQFQSRVIAGKDIKIVFMELFGSYFGDFDVSDNFLRAALASGSHTLATIYRINQIKLDPLYLGDTIGDCANTTDLVYVNLQGDPSLRIQQVKPVRNLRGAINAGRLELSWAPATDLNYGYHVYQSSNSEGPFVRLTTEPITASTFDVGAATSSTSTYMVRTVSLETFGRGSFFNLSQGSFLTLDISPSGAGFAVRVVDPQVTPAPLTDPAPVDFSPKIPAINAATVIPASAGPGQIIKLQLEWTPGPLDYGYYEVAVKLKNSTSEFTLDSHFFPVMTDRWIGQVRYEVPIRVSEQIAAGIYDLQVHLYSGGNIPRLNPGVGATAITPQIVKVGAFTVLQSQLPPHIASNLRIASSGDLQPGQTVPILWDSQGLSSIRIEAVDSSGNTSLNTVTPGAIPNTGVFNWTIPHGAFGGLAQRDFRLLLSSDRYYSARTLSQSTYHFVDNIPPATPSNIRALYSFEASTNKPKITVVWDYPSDAESPYYRLFQRASGATYGEPIDFIEIPQYEFFDFVPGLYYFKVVAVDLAGNAGPMSSEVAINFPSLNADSDNDGVGDYLDCASADGNSWRVRAYPDYDRDGVRDAAVELAVPCFGATPKDGFTVIASAIDNCPFDRPNPDQRDSDHDGFGDVCDYENPPGVPSGIRVVS